MSYLKKKIGAESQYKDLAEAIKKFESELTVIENNIHQTKNRSVQDPLNYGIKLNNRLAFLMIEQGQVDYRPNKQAEEVRMELTKKIDTELAKLRTIMDANITTIKKMIKEKGIEMVM